MKLGLCYQCEKKIGARSANGRFRYYANQMAQLDVCYLVNGKDYVHIHVPVCKECCNGVKYIQLVDNLKKTPEAKQFFKDNPTAEFVSALEEREPDYG